MQVSRTSRSDCPLSILFGRSSQQKWAAFDFFRLPLPRSCYSCTLHFVAIILFRQFCGKAASLRMADEKIADQGVETSPSNSELAIGEPTNKLQRWANRLDALAGVEARGIERIPDELRERKMTFRDYTHMFTMSALPLNTTSLPNHSR